MNGYQRRIAAVSQNIGGFSSRPYALVFSPNLLQSPTVADFVKRDGVTAVIASRPDELTIWHEYLHPFVSPYRSVIESYLPLLDDSRCIDCEKLRTYGYLWDTSDSSKVHAIEECFVRGIAIGLSDIDAGQKRRKRFFAGSGDTSRDQPKESHGKYAESPFDGFAREWKARKTPKENKLFYDKDGHPMKQSRKTENSKKINPLEPMDDFFTARVGGYDEHMLHDVNGCADGYRILAELLPAHTGTLLDLGCGTGLELDEIFKTHPDIRVTGIDLTNAMLDKLKAKHPDKNMTLIHASYFDVDFGKETYGAAVSFQTMHHFSHEKKLGLYQRIFGALKSGGVYLEGDYTAATQEEEDARLRENAKIRREQHIPDGAFYHYDIPFTADHQTALLKAAGFCDVRVVWRMESTAIVVAQK